MSDTVEHSTEVERVGAHGGADLPVHAPRRTDVDPQAARRAERQIATMFGLASLLVVGFVVAYVAFDGKQTIYVPVIGETSASNFFLGLTLGAALFLIGAGAIQWARKLMPDVEEVNERHPQRGTDDERAEAIAAFQAGYEYSGWSQRPLIRRSLLGAMLLLPIPAVVLLKDLMGPAGEKPGNLLRKTIWGPGVHVVNDVSLAKIRPEDIPFGGLVNAVPETLKEVEEAEGNLNARAKAPVVLVRLRREEINPDALQSYDGLGYEGILCYSKICTHVGCPTSLYEQRTHHLLCPCHQSTFDLADAGKVIFGPAARPMPQLAITVDGDGYLVSRGDFAEPVGPSYWERNRP